MLAFNKKIRNTLVLTIVVSFGILLFPYNIGASGTYTQFNQNEIACVTVKQPSGSSKPYRDYYLTSKNSNYRMVIIHQTSNNNYAPYLYYFVSEGGNNHNIWKSSNTSYALDDLNDGCLVSSPTMSSTSTYLTIDSIRYYYTYVSSYEKILDGFVVESDSSDSSVWHQLAYDYTYGDSSSLLPSYGMLIDLGYYTDFTTSQQSDLNQMRLNRDTIIWNGYEDSNGNQINTLDMEIEIQAYGVEYKAVSKSELLNKTILDFVNFGSPVTIYEGSANRGTVSFTWGEIVNYLNTSSTAHWAYSKLVPHAYESMWYSYGWLYRMRLKKSDDSYIGDWQTLYTVTSSPPSDSETIYNYYYYYGGQGINPDVINSIQNINNINNTTNNWYVDGNQIDPNGSNWLETLLKFIADLIGKILDFFSNIFDGLVELLLELFDGINPKDSFLNWWSNLKDYFNSIDLSGGDYNLPDSDISSFWVLPQRTLQVLTENNLEYVLFIPLLLFVLRLFL